MFPRNKTSGKYQYVQNVENARASTRQVPCATIAEGYL